MLLHSVPMIVALITLHAWHMHTPHAGFYATQVIFWRLSQARVVCLSLNFFSKFPAAWRIEFTDEWCKKLIMSIFYRYGPIFCLWRPQSLTHRVQYWVQKFQKITPLWSQPLSQSGPNTPVSELLTKTFPSHWLFPPIRKTVTLSAKLNNYYKKLIARFL